jgi:hypothetical protein
MEELPEHWPSVEEYTATCSIVRKKMAMADRDNTDSSADKRSLRDLFGGLLFYGDPCYHALSLAVLGTQRPIMKGSRLPLHMGF